MLGVTAHVSAQNKFNLPPDKFYSDFTLKEGAISGSFTLPAFRLVPDRPSADVYHIQFTDSYPSGKPGKYELPVQSTLLEIPVNATYQIVIESLDSVVIKLDQQLPGWRPPIVEEPAIKSGRNAKTHSLINDAKNVFWGSDGILSLEKEGSLRGVTIGRLLINPFRYDSISNELTVFYNIFYSLIPQAEPVYMNDNNNLTSPFLNILKPVKRDEFRFIKKKVISDDPITMVILTDSVFSQTLQPLIKWKREKGFRIIEAYASDPEVGETRTQIKDYLKSLYNNPPSGFSPPSYLLIIGDVEHIPLSQSGGQITDLYYTTYDGEDDFLPDIFHGRISVKDTSELNHVVEKILMYEKYGFPDPSYLNNSVLIAGYDAGYASRHGNGQINYAEEYYFNADRGIDAMKYLHPEASTMDREILEVISEGAAFVNYTGHGDYYGWRDPAFRMHHIDTMKNIHKYSFMIGNGCSTNLFNMNSKDCFAEAVLKVEDQGAIGYIGCTNDSYWDEDFYWAVGVGAITSSPDINKSTQGYYDKVFNTNVDEIDSWAPTMGEMIVAGNMAVMESNSSKKKYYWEIYQLMGDPSIAPWFREPTDHVAAYPSVLPPGATRLSVETRPFDLIALSAEDRLITAMHADLNGKAYIQLPDTLATQDLKIVITGDDRVPVFDSINRITENMPYLELIDYEIVNESVFSNGTINNGEQFSLKLEIVNSGNASIGGGDLCLSAENDAVMVVDSIYTFSGLEVADTMIIESGFQLIASDSVINRTLVPFTIEVFDASPNQKFIFRENIYAPDIISKGIRWDDRPYGNGNGLIEADELLTFRWVLENQGGFKSDSLGFTLNHSRETDIWNLDPSVGGLLPEEQMEFELQSVVSSDTMPTENFVAHFSSQSGDYKIKDSIIISFNQYFEDFSESYLKFHFHQEENPWHRDMNSYYGAPAALKSGKTGHNDESVLSIDIALSEADSISFYCKVSSEKNYDFLNFYIDSVLIDRWSGNMNWTENKYAVDSGEHFLSWVYRKDPNTVGGDDAAWIDNVNFPDYAVMGGDLSLHSLERPVSGGKLSASESVVVNVKNTGIDTITNFQIGYGLPENPWYEKTYTGKLPPDTLVAVTFDQPVDMSELRDYRFIAGIFSENDMYAGNDTLASVVYHYTYPDIAVSLNGIDSVANDYINLLVHMENLGNISFDSLDYKISLEGDSFKESKVLLSLLPGADTIMKINLIQPEDNLPSGWYEYMFEIASDSVPENNFILETVFWSLLSSTFSQNKLFRTYPNPVEDMLMLEIADNRFLPARMEVFNLEGRKVYTKVLRKQQTQLEAAVVFPDNGLYILKFSGRGGAAYSALVRVVNK